MKEANLCIKDGRLYCAMVLDTVLEQASPTSREKARTDSVHDEYFESVELDSDTDTDSPSAIVKWPPPQHSTARDTPVRKKTLWQETQDCLTKIDMLQKTRRSDVESQEQVQSEATHKITTADIFTATWNLNTRPLTPHTIQHCFSRVMDTQPVIIVLAFQEVDDFIGRTMFPKKHQDVANIRAFFSEPYCESTSLSHANQLLTVLWDPRRVSVDPNIKHHKLITNKKRTKGAVAVVLEYGSRAPVPGRQFVPGAARPCALDRAEATFQDERGKSVY